MCEFEVGDKVLTSVDHEWSVGIGVDRVPKGFIFIVDKVEDCFVFDSKGHSYFHQYVTKCNDTIDEEVDPRKPERMKREDLYEMEDKDEKISMLLRTISDLKRENRELSKSADKYLKKINYWKDNCKRAEEMVKQLSGMEIDLGKVQAAIGSIEFNRIVSDKD